MNTNMIQIIVLAGIALFLVLQLRRVLGTRDGFEQKPDQIDPNAPAQRRAAGNFDVIEGGGIDHDIADFVDIKSDTGKALAAMKKIEPSFSVAEFAGGARQAYEMILMAFENGDVDTLRDFLSPDVFEGFRSAVDARAEQGLTVDANFVGVRELKIVEAAFDEENKEAEITLRFAGELTSAVKDSEGRIVEGDPNEIKRQRDIWTFARLMGTDNPNWLLVATEN
jgi:predicted lipid-binding transport protein (Tim44 family)